MTNQQRQKGHSRTKQAVFGKSSKPSFGRIPARQAVFELSPAALSGFLDMDGEPLNPDVEPDELVDEALDDEADLDDRDDDEPGSEDEPGEWYSNRYLARLRESFEFAGLPVVDLGATYSISIIERRRHGFACDFQEPSWFHQAMDSEAGPFIERLVRFMRALGGWFEEERQPFLSDPSPERFVAIDADYPRKPVILQNGLLARVNTRVSEYDRLSEQDFSRLLDKVWLLWAQWCLPLRHVFSKEYQTEWVIQGCLRRCRETGVWLEKLSKDFTNEDLSQAKRKDFGNLSLEEMFRVLCDIADVSPKHTFNLALKRIQQGEGYGS